MDDRTERWGEGSEREKGRRGIDEIKKKEEVREGK